MVAAIVAVAATMSARREAALAGATAVVARVVVTGVASEAARAAVLVA